MQKISILIFPYRDAYFWDKYGCAVRDLHIIKALDSLDCVHNIILVNRPVSIYERFTSKKKKITTIKGLTKTHIYDVTDFDILGPLGKRKWLKSCYNKYLGELKKLFLSSSKNTKKIVLDFTPLSDINFDEFNDCYFWYDLIDNFSKHNRYSDIEKKLVNTKYANLHKYDLITAVSEPCFKTIDHKNARTVANGLVENTVQNDVNTSKKAEHTFGFIGFITDKFDILFLEHLLLTNQNSTAAIYGDAYDKEIITKLKSIKNVTCYGKFHENDVDDILMSFKFGIVPYRHELSHDESPLKIYKYLNAGKPIISTIRYEVENEYIFYVNESNISEMSIFINSLSNIPHEKLATKVKNTINRSYFWDDKLKSILSEI